MVLVVFVVIACYRFIKGAVSTAEFLYELWLFYAIVGLTFGSFAFTMNILRFLDDKKAGYAQSLIIPLFYLPILCVFTLFLYRKLIDLYLQ